MNLLGFINDEDAESGSNTLDLTKWNARIAVRGILSDSEGKVAIMHISSRGVYKLPGGGVDREEDLETGFLRELKEETGCVVKATGDIGVFVEKREEWEMVQISFAYFAEVVEMGELELTVEEKEEGFELLWVDNIEKALELVKSSARDTYDDKFMVLRDKLILEKALELSN